MSRFSALEIPSGHATNFAGRFRRRNTDSSASTSRPNRQQHPRPSLSPDSRAQSQHPSLGSPFRRPLRCHQHRSARIRKPPPSLVCAALISVSSVPSVVKAFLLATRPTAADKLPHPSSQNPPSPSVKHPPTDPRAPPQYPPTFQ